MNWYCRVKICILIAFLSFSIAYEIPCFSPYNKMPFPQILGGSSDKQLSTDLTQFLCLSYDPLNRKILAGGSSQATGDLVNQKTSPIIVKYDEISGQIDWNSQIQPTANINAQQFTLCAIQDSGPFYLALSDSPGFGIFLFQQNTGSLDSAFYEYNSGIIMANRKPIGAIMQSDGTIFLVTQEGTVLMLAQLKYYQQTLTRQISVKFDSNINQATGSMAYMSPISTDISIYIAGSLNKQVSMFKFSKIDYSNWVVSIKDTLGVQLNQEMKTLSTYNSSANTQTHFGCAENLGTSTNDLAFIQLDETIGQVPSSGGKTWYIYVSSKGRCLSTINNQTHGKVLIHKESDSVFITTISFSSTITILSFQKISINGAASLASFVKTGFFYKGDWSSSFFAGSINKITTSTYTPQVAFLMNLPYITTNVTSLAQPTTASISCYQNLFFNISIPTYLPQLFYANTNTITQYQILTPDYLRDSQILSLPLKNISAVRLPDDFYQLQPQAAILNGNQTITYNVSYQLNTSMMNLEFSDFQYNMTCPDVNWKYEAIYSPLPPSGLISFNQTSTGGQFQIWSSDLSLNGSFFNITYIGTVGGLYSKNQTFQLNLFALPPPPPSPSPIVNITNSNSTNITVISNTTTNTTTSATSNQTSLNSTTTINQTSNTTNSTNTTLNSTSSSNSSTNSTLQNNTTLTLNKTQCTFLSEPAALINIEVNQIIMYEFPKSNCLISLSPLVKTQQMPLFINFDQQMSILTVNPKSQGQVGRYGLDIALNEIKQSIMIIEVVKKDLNQARVPSSVNNNIPKNQVNQSNVKNQQVEQLSPLTMKIKSIGMNGLVVLSFNTRVLIPVNYQSFSQNVELDIFVNEKLDAIKDWKVLIFNEQGFQLQVTYKNPEFLSSFQEPDILIVKVKDNLKFLTMKNQTPFKLGYSCSKQIPMQFPSKNESTTLQQIAGILKTSSTAVIVGVMALSLAMTIVMQQLWGMINTLQFILHVPLFSMSLPANIMIVFQALFNMITFDYIDTNDKLQAVFGLSDASDYPAYNDKFDMLGYSTTNTLYNIGLPIFMMLVYFSLLIVYLVLQKLPYKLCKKMREILQPKVLWDVPFRFIMELSLEGVISSFINIKSYITGISHINNIGEFMTVMVSGSLVILNIIFAIVLTRLLIKHRQSLESNQFLQNYFSEFTEDQRILWTGQLYYHAIFVLRRFLMVAIIFALEDYATLQVFSFFLMNLLYSAYAICFRPLHEQWKYEIFNEITTLLLSSILFSFTDYVSDPHFKYHIAGYAFISIFAFNVGVNVIAILLSAILTIYKNIKYLIILCKFKIKKRSLKYEIANNISKTVSQKGKQKSKYKNKLLKLCLNNLEGLDNQKPKNLFIIQEEASESSPQQKIGNIFTNEKDKYLRNLAENTANKSRQSSPETLEASPQIPWGYVGTPFKSRKGNDETAPTEKGRQNKSRDGGFSLQLCSTPDISPRSKSQTKSYEILNKIQSNDYGDSSNRDQVKSSSRRQLLKSADEFTPKLQSNRSQLFQKVPYINATQKKHHDDSSRNNSPDYSGYHREQAEEQTPQFKRNHQEQALTPQSTFVEIAREYDRNKMSQVPSHYFKQSKKEQKLKNSQTRNALTEMNNDIEQNIIMYTSPEYGGSPEPLKKRQTVVTPSLEAKDIIFSTFSNNNTRFSQPSKLFK